MSKGQIAMTAARVLLVSGKTQQQAAKLLGVSQQRVSQAATVLEFAPDLVLGILAGSEFLVMKPLSPRVRVFVEFGRRVRTRAGFGGER